MKVTLLDIIDWEPCMLRLGFSSLDRETFAHVKAYVETWLGGSNSRGCGCKYRYAEFSEKPSSTMVVESEWMCRECVQALANAIQKKFSNLRTVELGIRDQGNAIGADVFISVPAKSVEFEDGTRFTTLPFRIGWSPVTVGCFEKFVHETGYVTLAEHQGSPETFRMHCGLDTLPPKLRSEQPVQFVSRPDALAFCNARGYRLPTEAEWLAAAVTEVGEKDIDALEELRLASEPISRSRIYVSNWDVTASTTCDGKVITRRGPLRFLKKGWRQPPLFTHNRRVIGAEEYDMSITFRVIKTK